MTDAHLLTHIQQHAHGRDRAISRAALALVCGCHDRAIREAIERLRRAGHAIGVGRGGGYFIAQDAAEVAEIVDSYRRRVESECQTANLLRRNWPQVAGLQLVLVDEAGQAQLLT